MHQPTSCFRIRHKQFTGLDYKAVPRLRECCMQVEAEVVSNSRNKIHQTWEWPYSPALYVIPISNHEA